MTAIPGVEIERDINGEVTHISIDVRQHKEAIPVLEELGLIQNELKKGYSIEESKAHVHEVIKRFYENDPQ